MCEVPTWDLSMRSLLGDLSTVNREQMINRFKLTDSLCLIATISVPVTMLAVSMVTMVCD